jgi:hypothetical protein
MMRKRAISEVECPDCAAKGTPCDKHNLTVRELDLPEKVSGASKEYELDKTYQEKDAAGPNISKAILDYVKQKRMALADTLNKRGENALAAQVVTDLHNTVPGAKQMNTGMLAGVIAKYLVQLTQKSMNEKIVAPFSDSQFLQEIEPIVDRKQSSLEEDKTALLLPGVIDSKVHSDMANLAYEWHNGGGSALYEFASNDGHIPEERVPQLLSEIDHCINVVSADPDSYDAEDKEKLEFLKKYVSDFHGTPQKKETPMAQDHNKLSNLKLAAEGGAEEEEATEEQTSVDSSIVALLESAKNEWTGLGDPVNPATWPKEVERAILALNDAIVKAIESTQAKLAEGDFYSKNVDEGVDSVGGGSATGIGDLNIAPAEPELNDELPMEEGPVDNKALVGDKKSSKKASSDIGSTETKKALKFTQDLSERIAGIFFDYKKTVEVANNSSLVKSAGEDMVRLKVKLNEVEKVLDKQLDVLSLAEDSIEDAKKQQAKKSSKECADGCCGKCKEGEKCDCSSGKCECKKASKVAKPSCSKCGEAFTPAKPDHKLCPSCHTSKKKASLFMGLTLASEE